jgi:HK97 family phage portal protein
MGFLVNAFEKRDVSVVGDELWRSIQANSGLAGINVTPEIAMTFSAVFAAHKILAESTAMLPLFLLKRLDPRGKEQATKHPLYNVLHDVANPEMDSYLVRETMTNQMVGWGRAYAKIDYDQNGQVKALWPIPSARVTNRRDKNLQLVFDVAMPDGGKKTYQWYEMYFLRGLSADGINTYTPIALQKQGIGLALAAEGFGAALFGNGARPQGVLTHPGSLKEKAQKNILDSWNDVYRGVGKSNQIALLEEGMKFENIGVPPEDAQFLQTRQFQVEEIARWYRIPNMMLNMTGANSTYASVEAFGLQFYTYTLYPWLVRWEKSVSMQLLLERERKRLVAEHQMAAILRGDTTSRYASYGTGRQWGWLSVNDIRYFENMNPVEGGDTYLTPSNMMDVSAPAKIQRSYMPVLTDAIQRVLRREANDIRAGVQKVLVKRGAEEFADWLSEFYQEHQDFTVRSLMPAAQSYAEILAGGMDLAEVNTKVSESLRLFAIRRAGQVQEQIKNALSEPDAQASIEALLSGWDNSYVDRIARSEISRQTTVLVMPVKEPEWMN